MKNIILIPVYNDWKSLNKLLVQINNSLSEDNTLPVEIVIVNDFSNVEMKVINNNFKNINQIKVLNLNKNLGSQKAIAIGLYYLSKLKDDFLITVMDSDGEDNPLELKKMIKQAIEKKEYVITSNRKQREESLFIKIMYKIHLILTFMFTLKWISFGNFTTFYSKNLSLILKNNNSWYAHSSSVLSNCQIIRLYAKREKRYFDKSKLNFYALVEHSLRVNAVFYRRILMTSFTYILILTFFAKDVLFFSTLLLIIFYNFLIFLIKRKHFIKDMSDLELFIENVKLV